jgi:hypothetical protein
MSFSKAMAAKMPTFVPIAVVKRWKNSSAHFRLESRKGPRKNATAAAMAPARTQDTDKEEYRRQNTEHRMI